MKCPFCGNLDDKVLESRQNNSGTTIRRRRECLSCNYRFTSYEKIEEIRLKVIKRDGSREDFDRKKIQKGLERAIEKRPVTQLELEAILAILEDEIALRCRTTHEIETSSIGEMVMTKLSELDSVAYVRFASVYGNFEKVEEFIGVIESMTSQNKKKE